MPVSKRTAAEQQQQSLPSVGTVPNCLVPYWQSECGRAVVYVGDCREVLARMEPDQFHAAVTDPPYGLEFMGKDWDAPWKHDGKLNSSQSEDTTGRGSWAFGGTPSSKAGRPCYGNKKIHARQTRADELIDPVKAQYLRHNVEYVRDGMAYQVWFQSCAEMVMRAAKPGAHLLSFGGTRMWHRMSCAVEDAGWEIRDTVMWVYGSGFPKGNNIGKAIDKMLGAERLPLREGCSPIAQGNFNARNVGSGGYRYKAEYKEGDPVTKEAQQWDGWNTALKPSYEPIIVARKPLIGSVAQNVMEHGCGGINVDGCRVGIEERWNNSAGNKNLENRHTVTPISKHNETGGRPAVGRWPANLIHDGSEEVVELFPHTVSTKSVVTSKPGTIDGAGKGLPSHTGEYGFNDSGSAARFFYTAKADDDDRPHGRNATSHPTCKPLDLMRYLVRLVCAPGGIVLDPFMGSGSTGCAAIEEGMRFVGIEQSAEYADIAVGRLRLALENKPVGEVAPIPGRDQNARQEPDTPPPPRRLRGQ